MFQLYSYYLSAQNSVKLLDAQQLYGVERESYLRKELGGNFAYMFNDRLIRV